MFNPARRSARGTPLDSTASDREKCIAASVAVKCGDATRAPSRRCGRSTVTGTRESTAPFAHGRRQRDVAHRPSRAFERNLAPNLTLTIYSNFNSSALVPGDREFHFQFETHARADMSQ